MSQYLSNIIEKSESDLKNNEVNTDNKMPTSTISTNFTNFNNSLDPESLVENEHLKEKESTSTSIVGSVFRTVTASSCLLAILYGFKYSSDNSDYVRNYFTQERMNVINNVITPEHLSDFNIFMSNNWLIVAAVILIIPVIKLMQVVNTNLRNCFTSTRQV